MKKSISALVLLLTVFGLSACGSSEGVESTSDSGDNPVKITLGVGYSTEENLWLLDVAPELVTNYGEEYTLELQQFRANTDRLNAYQAGQIHGGTIGQGAAIMSAAQGVDMSIVFNIAKETPDKGFNSTFMASSDSGLESAADLQGKTIGIPDFKSPTDMWARAAIREAGLDPDEDVEYAVLPPPAAEEAVKSGNIDVGLFPQPFYDIAQQSGEIVSVFDSKDGVPVEEDFFNLFIDPQFVEDNPEAIQALIEDLQEMTEYYVDNSKEARQKLLDEEYVLAEPEVYLNMEDYNRSVDGSFNKESWEVVQELLLEDDWIETEVDLDALVDDSFLNN